MERSDLPDTEFKMIVIKILTKVRRRMHEQSRNFHEEIEILKKKKKKEITDLRNTTFKLKKLIEGFNHRLVEERIGKPEDKTVKFT